MLQMFRFCSASNAQFHTSLHTSTPTSKGLAFSLAAVILIWGNLASLADTERQVTSTGHGSLPKRANSLNGVEMAVLSIS